MTKRAKRSPYTRERKAEALALARIAGAEVSSDRTHIPVQTIRRWMDAAGIQPGTDLPQERLEALRDLAEATVTRDLVEGRIRGVQAMTVAGIARRHIANPAPPPDAAAVSVVDTFWDWLVDTVPEESFASQEAEGAATEAVHRVIPNLLLRRSNAESGQPHRRAILAWISGRPEVPAGDVLFWAQNQVNDILAEHGSLVAWSAWLAAEDAAERAKADIVMAEARVKAEAARAAALQASPPPDLA